MPSGNLKVTEDPYHDGWKVSWNGTLGYVVSKYLLHKAHHPADVLAEVAKMMAKAIERDIFEQLLASTMAPESLQGITTYAQAQEQKYKDLTAKWGASDTLYVQGSWNDPDHDILADIKKYAQVIHESNPAAGISMNPIGQAHGVLETLEKVVPGLKTAKVKECPAKCGSYKQAAVANVIMHLNDEHRWTREAIADWLETLDADLSFQEPQDPGTCQKCRYQAEGKWDGAKSVSHSTDCPKYEGMKGYTPSFVIEDEAAEFASNHKLDALISSYMSASLLKPEDAAKIINPS